MNTITASNYRIHFNEKAYPFLNKKIAEKKYSKIFIICDTNTHEYCLPYFLPLLETDIAFEIIEFEAGEINKNIETCVQIWHALTELGGDRKSLVINVGGGVVTDLGGFVASTFKRGVDFIHIPTTLLSMVDASVGGKNGVDLGNLKNQVGVINNPMMVVVDSAFLNTLPAAEIRSGMAEMLKHGLIYDKEYWNAFSGLTNENFTSLNNIDQLIYRSVEIKNDVVTQDPRENGLRKALNFGHTLGHAIESYFLESTEKKTLLHGEAIAVGMILESYIGMKKDLLTGEEFLEIKNLINRIYDKISFENNDIEQILELLIHDKKNEYGTIQFALLDGIGKIAINQTVTNDLIYSAFDEYQNKI